MSYRSTNAAIAFLLMLPVGVALAQGGGGGGAGGSGAAGAGAAGSGGGQGGTGTSAGGGGTAVGGGAPAGAVGGGAPAGAVGGGAPATSTTNNSAPAASPSAPAQKQAAPTTPADNPPTSGGVIGGNTGAPPAGQVAPAPPFVADRLIRTSGRWGGYQDRSGQAMQHSSQGNRRNDDVRGNTGQAVKPVSNERGCLSWLPFLVKQVLLAPIPA